jgi:hypothetical protein
MRESAASRTPVPGAGALGLRAAAREEMEAEGDSPPAGREATSASRRVRSLRGGGAIFWGREPGGVVVAGAAASVRERASERSRSGGGPDEKDGPGGLLGFSSVHLEMGLPFQIHFGSYLQNFHPLKKQYYRIFRK